MKRRVTALLMAVVMCVLAGCGAGGGNTGAGTGNTDSGAGNSKGGDTKTESAQPLSGTEDPSQWPSVAVEIPSMNNMDDVPMVQDAINEYLASIGAGVQINLVPVEIGNIATAMTLMLTGGDDPIDLFSWRWYSNIVNVVKNEQAIPLDDYKEIYPELWELADPNVLKSHIVNGKTYGFPTMDGFCTCGYYCLRKDIAEELGIADQEGERKTIDEITQIMMDAKAIHPEYVYMCNTTNGSNLTQIDSLGSEKYIGVLLNNGVNQTEIVNYFETDEFRQFCDYTRQWAQNGLIVDDPLNQEITLNLYENGVSAGFLAGSYSVANLKASTTYMTKDYVAFQVSDLAGMGSSIGGGWCISSVTKNADASMKMLYLLETDANLMNLIALGIEGTHYILDENGCAWYPEGKNAQNAAYNSAADWFFPNRYLTHPFQNSDPDYFETMKNVSKEAVWSNAMGFAFDTEPVYDKYTACLAVVDQYLDALMYGQVDVDTYLPTFQEELKTAGIDDVIAEMQTQFNAFLGN